MTNTIVRVTTEDGSEGVGGVSNYTSYDNDRYTCETLRHLIPGLIGRNKLEREAAWLVAASVSPSAASVGCDRHRLVGFDGQGGRTARLSALGRSDRSDPVLRQHADVGRCRVVSPIC